MLTSSAESGSAVIPPPNDHHQQGLPRGSLDPVRCRQTMGRPDSAPPACRRKLRGKSCTPGESLLGARFLQTACAPGRYWRLLLFGAMLCALSVFIDPARAGQVSSTRQPDRAAEHDIPGLIRKLGDPAYAVRTAATRELCRVGAAAREDLEFAAESKISETALRARMILKALDQVYFAGVDVSLSFSAEKTPWDQPVDLVVTLVNRSDHPARLPFTYSDAVRGGKNPDAMQVGRMIDLADWLVVREEGGRELELRVDSITVDDDVRAAVERRLRDAPTSQLPPGEQVELRVAEFNRGWARYAMLERGDYTVAFRYEPEWEDSVLAAEGAGRVTAGPATLTVLTSAPEAVSRGGQEASVSLERAGDAFAVFLINHHDRAQVVNRNLGPATPFAQGNWVFERNDRTVELSAADTSRAHDEFSGEKLVTLAPGARVELVGAPLGELRKRLAAGDAEAAEQSWKLRFSYNNHTDRRWQDREVYQQGGDAGVPEALRARLPANMLTGRFFSNEVSIAAPQPGG